MQQNSPILELAPGIDVESLRPTCGNCGSGTLAILFEGNCIGAYCPKCLPQITEILKGENMTQFPVSEIPPPTFNARQFKNGWLVQFNWSSNQKFFCADESEVAQKLTEFFQTQTKEDK